VGVPGLYHGEKGVILQSPNMRDWIGMPLKKHLNKILPRPVRIDNDANATVVAEKLFGVAKNKKTFIYITVSTGIGSGVIVDGKLIKGVSFSAGEIGQQIVCPEDTWKNNVGVSGTLENVASGSSIARIATNRAKINNSKLTPLLKQRKITSKDVKDAALKGDRVARSVLLDAGKYLGMGLSNLIMILNPELIILGGGVLSDKGADIILKSMKKTISSHTWPEPRKACIVIKTRSLDKIADLGALSLVFQD